MTKHVGRAALMLLVVLSAFVAAEAGVLYDGGLGTLPGEQGWIYLTDPLIGASATQTVSEGVTILDTTPETSDSAGYFSSFHPGVPVLDRNTGYTVRFDVQILEESHVNSKRAGFSVIVLSDDNLGIEIGFWTDEVWAQSGPSFTKAESALFDTTAGLTSYDLVVLGSDYDLLADSTSILSGPLRDYSPHGHLVYSGTNFLFLGDNTSSADARIALASVEVSLHEADAPAAPIPEPAALSLLGLSLLAVNRNSRC